MLLHFRFKETINPQELATINPPGLVQFDSKQHEAFLLFLRKQSEDGYVAVSGQMDPEFSVMRLDRSWFFKERSKVIK